MKYIKTYENIFSDVHFWGLLSNKYLKRIKIAINKLLFNTQHKWINFNKKNSALIIKQSKDESVNIWRNIYIDIEIKNWTEISIKKDVIIPELLYIKSLLNEYGTIVPIYDSFYANFDRYQLTLDNIEKFIEKLDIKDFNLYQTKSKYNL